MPVATNGSAPSGGSPQGSASVINGQHPNRAHAAKSAFAEVGRFRDLWPVSCAPIDYILSSACCCLTQPEQSAECATIARGSCLHRYQATSCTASVQALQPARLWQRVTSAAGEVWAMLGQLLSPALRRTTLLLLFIWWSNAIVYYGLVLLATTVHTSDAESGFMRIRSCEGVMISSVCWTKPVS